MLMSLVMVIGMSVASALICPSRKSQLTDGFDLISKTGITDNIDFKTAAEFGEKAKVSAITIESRYSGSVFFGCETGGGQGQIVVNRDIVLVPAHILFKDNDCNKPKTLSKCGIIYQDGAKDDIIHVKKAVHPAACPPGEKLRDANDWAVLQLERKVPTSVKPYGLPKNGESMKAGDRLLDVGKSSRFNPEGKAGAPYNFAKGFAECVSMVRDPEYHENLMQTNCPTSEGCSGCGLFKDGDSPVLMGIMKGELMAENGCFKGDQRGPDGMFWPNCRSGMVVPIEGKVLEALTQIKPAK